MSKKDDCMEEQPGWYNGQFLDEVGFCCDFVFRHPMVCVGGKFFSKEGRIHDENGIKKQIYEMLLHSDYERVKGILDRIPPEIIREYTHRSTQKHDINR